MAAPTLASAKHNEALVAANHRKLAAHVCEDLVQLGRLPGDMHPPPSGSSNNDAAAAARCSASSPDQRSTHAARAVASMAACTSEAPWLASSRSQWHLLASSGWV